MPSSISLRKKLVLSKKAVKCEMKGCPCKGMGTGKGKKK